MSDEKIIMPLSEKEKNIMQAYSSNIVTFQAELKMLQVALNDMCKVALYARGLSPETHLIDEKGEIQEIKR